ncbi:hypothetical protein AJ80_09336 [Polytolypa hystricis UAMH7299]|uniref:DUF7770 domain-containing protein n=1 Tax=Polytolypa hystricis (strain UAMH7299) TaxID=1447883 RepID=A0A2B7WSL4_POLH7|nr:hypothetical protein AJ80_09336 [Polytolypa hystricis UAMH7299]
MSSAPVSNSDRTLTVTTIRVTVHTQGFFFDCDTRSSNHASIFLIAGPSKSIRLNMIKAGTTDTMGTYTETSCPYIQSVSSLHDIDVVAAPGLTVGRFLDVVHQKGLNKYELHYTGVGCRYWVKSVIEAFESAGFIDPSSPVSASQVAHDLEYNYTKNNDREHDPIRPGKFV